MINIFIVGSKGIPAKYGGFETFVENLTKRKTDPNIHYFVSCMGDEDKVFEYNDATCFTIKLEKDTASGRLFNVARALEWIEKYLSDNKSNDPSIVYILGCRVGLLISKHKRRLKKLNCSFVTNPDGLEWKRDKWNWLEKKILLYSEKKLIKNSDYIICDSKGICDYILSRYSTNPNKTKYIAYGSDVSISTCSDETLNEWLSRFGVSKNDYYLIIGRFVPENNYELIIREFMKSKTDKKLLIITNVEKNDFYKRLQESLHFDEDKRIVFAGTLYDEQLVKKVRENAFCYLHGHSVGGTNPSLLEALASTKVNLLYDVCFNKEVGEDQCLYFSNADGDLANKIDSIEKDHDSLQAALKAKDVITSRFSWSFIVQEYETFFNNLANELANKK